MGKWGTGWKAQNAKWVYTEASWGLYVGTDLSGIGFGIVLSFQYARAATS